MIQEEDAKALKVAREPLATGIVEPEEPDGREWRRGKRLGGGCHAVVHMATLTEPRAPGFKEFPPVMAVKTFHKPWRPEHENEVRLLRRLRDCPYVIRYLGQEETLAEDGTLRLNLFLEFASGGNLYSLTKASKGRLEEDVVRRHTRSILQGVKRIHDEGYVHCDLFFDNILLVEEGHEMVAKVADLGLVKRAGEQRDLIGCCAPESLTLGWQEKPSDIWGFGGIVLKLLGGTLRGEGVNLMPVFPMGLSPEAEDFLGKCFVMRPEDRATAEELVRHPFVCPNKGRKVGQRMSRRKTWKEWLIPLCTSARLL